MNRLSIVNNDFNFSELMRAITRSPAAQGTFARILQDFVGGGECRITGRGYAGLHAVLKAYKERHPDRDEVLIPAYTASGLVLPARQLGLRPVLCDLSPDGFLMDADDVARHYGPRTLAVIPVHMFGLPYDVTRLAHLLGPDAADCLIEDCAQALGTELNGQKAGSFAPVSFGSFARGKNFSLYYGGFLSINGSHNRDRIIENLEALPNDGLSAGLRSLSKFVLFSLATSPSVYGTLSRPLSLLKSSVELAAFDAHRPAGIVERRAAELFALWRSRYQQRIANGRYLFNALRTAGNILLPEYPAAAAIAFNRFPIIVPDPSRRERMRQELSAHGIEASFMYGRPVHHVFDLGYRSDELPNAGYLAGHLLTLPVYGTITTKDLDKMVDIIYSISQ